MMKPSRRLPLALLCALSGGSFLAAASSGSVVYDTTGATYTQNFDSLPTTPTNTSLGNSPAGWIDDTTTPGTGQFSILGWYLYHPTSVTEGGANGHQRMRISTGSSTTGAFYSFGSGSDRALGDVGANTLAANGDNLYYALRLTNGTTDTLTDFTLSFTGEQWRQGASTTSDPISFAYSTDATSSTFFDNTGANATFTAVPSLTFNAPQSTGAGAALDGNAAANSQALSATVSGINWAPGTDLWLRWASLQDPLTDHGMAIECELHRDRDRHRPGAGVGAAAVGWWRAARPAPPAPVAPLARGTLRDRSLALTPSGPADCSGAVSFSTVTAL